MRDYNSTPKDHTPKILNRKTTMYFHLTCLIREIAGGPLFMDHFSYCRGAFSRCGYLRDLVSVDLVSGGTFPSTYLQVDYIYMDLFTEGHLNNTGVTQ